MRTALALSLLALACGDDSGAVDSSVRDSAFPDSTVPEETITLRTLVEEMATLDPLMTDLPYVTLQASSWDRRSVDPSDATTSGWYANTDKGHYQDEVRVDGRREYVMLEAEGAGAIVR
ncbi:MAG: hypothetical protein AAGE52_08555, partial [Myxococcota bacterium]